MTSGCLTVCLDIDPTIERLALRTFRAMFDNEIDEPIVERLVRNLFTGQMLGVEPTGDGVLSVKLKPFGELALLEAHDLSVGTALDAATKGRKLSEVFRLAGMTTGGGA